MNVIINMWLLMGMLLVLLNLLHEIYWNSRSIPKVIVFVFLKTVQMTTSLILPSATCYTPVPGFQIYRPPLFFMRVTSLRVENTIYVHAVTVQIYIYDCIS